MLATRPLHGRYMHQMLEKSRWHILSYLDNKFVSLLIKQNTVGVNGFNQSLSTPGWERGRTWTPRPEEERLANLEKKHKRMEKLGLIKPVAVGA